MVGEPGRPTAVTAVGVDATALALQSMPSSWTVLHDVVWPRRQYVDVDHVAIGPPGVFVIATRSSPGRGRGNAIQELIVAAAAVSELVPSVRFDHVHAILCVTDHDGEAGWPDGVLLCSADQLVEELTSYVEVIPGGVGRVVAADIQRTLGASLGPRPVAGPRANGFAERMQTARQQAASARKPIGMGGLVRFAMGGAVAIALISQPQLVTSVSSDIADFVSEAVNPDDREQDRIKKPGQNRNQKQKQREQEDPRQP